MFRAVQIAFLLFFPAGLLLTCSDEQPPAPPITQEPETSSHELSWTTDMVSDAQSNLQHLFVVNDSIVYAVGIMYKRDSTGKFENDPYNAVRWDGQSWTPLRIPVILCGTGVYAPIELQTGFGFAENRIHFFPPGILAERTDTGYRYDCTLQYKINGPARSVFPYSNQDYYLIGDQGVVVHWDGTAFTREATGVDWPTMDIFGNEHELWAVAGTPSDHKGGVIYKTRNGGWGMVDSLSDGGTRSVNSVWCEGRSYEENGFVILAGRGIWYRDTTWKRPPVNITGGNLGLGNLYFSSVRGIAKKDVFACGDFDIVVHFNGRSWHFYKELFKYPGGGILTSIAFTKHEVFITGGYADGVGRIIHGTRR